MCIFWRSLKLQFFGLKMIVFYLKYSTMIFSDIISVKNSDKRKFDFWTKSMDYPFKKCPFFGHCFNFVFWSFNDCFRFKYPKRIFSDIVSVKNSDNRNFDFWTKSRINPFGKCPFYGPF